MVTSLTTDLGLQYMFRTMDGPTELWRMRKEFTLQIASASFLTYVLALSSRTPSRFHLSRATGQIALSEVLPSTHSFLLLAASGTDARWGAGIPTQQTAPIIASPDMVPFRLTPNMQHFIGPIHTEGLLVSSLMAIGRSLSEPEVRPFLPQTVPRC